MEEITASPPKGVPQVTAKPWEEGGAPQIPFGLTTQEQGVYHTLIRAMKRQAGQAPPRVVVITDLGKDYDDLAAMVVLKELHRLGLIKLEGFIANLHPPKTRAQLGRCVLDLLGLEDIPIAWGEEAEARTGMQKPPHDYEFGLCDFLKPDSDFVMTPYDQDKANRPGGIEIESGVKFLDRLVQSTIQKPGEAAKQKLTFLLISSLADIATYAKREPEHLAAVTENIILQGDYSIEQAPTPQHSILIPNLQAANNGFDVQSSSEFHAYMGNHHIPSVVFTKVAAIAASMSTEVFDQLAGTTHPIGIHLQKIQSIQDTRFYDNACNGPRHMPHMNQDWFLSTKTRYFQEYSEDDPRPKPVQAEVLQYVNLLLYDALAALGTLPRDVLRQLDVLDPRQPFLNEEHSIHNIIGKAEMPAKDGKEKVPKDTGIKPENMKLAITALLKGSLLACEQGISSRRKT
jgi:hypothetical protein